MYYAFPSSIDLICVCEIRLSLHAVTLGSASFFWVWISPSSSSTWQAHKWALINNHSTFWYKYAIGSHLESPKCHFIDGIRSLWGISWIQQVWSESRSVVSDSLWPHELYRPWNSPGQNTGVGSYFLLQGIFPTLGSNPSPPHCRWILYQLCLMGSPRILEWVAIPFSRGSSRPRNWTRVSCIAGGFFTSWDTREVLNVPRASFN